jgi:RecB family exonuclease
MNCAGSVALIGDEQGTSSHAAMLGTAAHKIVERMIERGETDARRYFEYTVLVKIASDDETKIFPSGADIPLDAGWSAYVVDEKMIDGVQMMIDEVERAKLELDHPKVHGERSLDMTWLDPRFGGTADVTLVEAFGWVHLLDYKNGYMVVEVKNNEQMKSYAVGLLHEHPDAEGIRVTIVQPNAPHEEGAIRSESYTRDEIKLFEIQMKEAALATDAPNAPRRAGKWCTFCPAKTRCPEFEGRIAASAAEDFGFAPGDGPMPETMAVAFSGAMKIDDTALEALSDKGHLVPLVDKWCREIEGAIQNALMNGNAVPGFKLVTGKANRKWGDDEATIKRQLSNGLGSDEFKTKVEPFLMTEPKLKSPAQVEKIGDKDTRKELKKLVSEIAIKPLGRLTVADENDPRAAVSPADAALADFGGDPVEGVE